MLDGSPATSRLVSNRVPSGNQAAGSQVALVDAASPAAEASAFSPVSNSLMWHPHCRNKPDICRRARGPSESRLGPRDWQ